MTTHPTSDERRASRSAVRDRAAGNNGIFRRSDLEALGIDQANIRTFLRRGWWTRLHHGVYVDSEVLAAAVEPEELVRLLLAAAQCAIPGVAYAFGPSAGSLHSLAMDRRLRGSLCLVRPLSADQRTLHRRITRASHLAGVTIHRHAIEAEFTVNIDGIPSVDRWDAAITTAAREDPLWAVATLDSAVWKDSEGLEQLQDRLPRWSGLRGIGVVRRALPNVRTGAQTPLETISRLRIIAGGLTEPELQFPVYDEKGLIGYADVAWPDLKVIGEADGMTKYNDRSDLVAEKLREDRLRALGWIVVRWTWAEILNTPWVVVARIRKAMALARRRAA